MFKIIMIIALTSFISLQSHPEDTLSYTNYVKEPSILDKEYVATLIYRTGFPLKHVQVITCIAEKESNFRVNARNKNRNKTTDYGLFQINSIWLSVCNTTPEELNNPHKNAKCALIVYKKQGLKAWSAYNTYTKYCHAYRVDSFRKTKL